MSFMPFGGTMVTSPVMVFLQIGRPVVWELITAIAAGGSKDLEEMDSCEHVL